MDSKQQNIQTNTFSGGMNSDVADHLLNSDQYRYARNLRFVHGPDGDTGQLQCINGDKEIFQGLGYIKQTNMVYCLLQIKMVNCVYIDLKYLKKVVSKQTLIH